MRAGRLRFRMTVQMPVDETNAVGEAVRSWKRVREVWADITPLRGEERLTTLQIKPTIDTKITVRSSAIPGLTPDMRLVHKERIFDIDSTIDWQNRGVFSEIYCTEAV